MSDLGQILEIAASGMRSQSSRLRLNSENMANIDTPGYRRKTGSFESVFEGGKMTGEVRPSDTRLDQSDLNQIFDPAHPMASEDGFYEGSNVNILVEIADAREAQRSYEANLKIFEQARKMSSSLLDLLRQ